MTEPQCEGCGRRPEVYGSSWCARCAATLPRYAKERLIQLRNGLIEISHGKFRGIRAMRSMAIGALQHQSNSTASTTTGAIHAP